ncbi:MAG TPA: V-type ATP synthase subunit I [Candidatus Hydrogenedentes bacterium]|nr:V-type ATP synthase subunit I [Candidatus Hydrogenedentota bacterium]
MAIDRMQRATFLCPKEAIAPLVRALHKMGAVEFHDVLAQHDASAGQLTQPETSTEDSDRALSRIHFILNLLDHFVPEKKTFVEGLAPLPLVVDEAELRQAVEQFDLEEAFHKATDLDDAYRNAERLLAETQAKLAEAMPFADIPYMLGEIETLRHIRVMFVRIPPAQLPLLEQDEEVKALSAREAVSSGPALRKDHSANAAPPPPNQALDCAFVFLRQDEETMRRLLAKYGFEELPIPHADGKVRDRIRELQADIAEYSEHLEQAAARIRALRDWRRPVSVLKGYWEGRRARSLAIGLAAQGHWTGVLAGYVRAEDAPPMQRMLQQDFPGVSMVLEDPAPDDPVPVHLSLPGPIRPIRMLVKMFGLPPYAEFDPSPFIIWNFLLFFGICFGDVGYGLMLTTFGLILSRKTRQYEGVNDFLRLLTYGGVSTIFFGFIFGSWFGNLVEAQYLGENNPFLRVKEATMLLDPLEKPLVMLAFALGIGILNQFYGVGLMMYGLLRKGDWMSALCDGLFWLIALPGMVLMVVKLLADVPDAVFTTGLLLFAVGATGLVLTQGRAESTLFGKIATGVVSLYGIVGTYGCTAFLGDTLSYCRLLALGLTTSIIALCVNMIAGLLRDAIPGVGIVVFIALVIVGHLFNFGISLLGAFIHAMRLIFVEFFGRFYSGGARPFQPLSMSSETFLLKPSPAGATGAATPPTP